MGNAGTDISNVFRLRYGSRYSCYTQGGQSRSNLLRDLGLLSTTVQLLYCTGTMANITCDSQAGHDDECPPHGVATTGSTVTKKTWLDHSKEAQAAHHAMPLKDEGLGTKLLTHRKLSHA